MTVTLLAQIAPQRSTQYTQLASMLAPYELLLSPVGELLVGIEPVVLGGQDYLMLTMDDMPHAEQLEELGRMAMLGGVFRYYQDIGDEPGPFLKPIELLFEPFVHPDIVFTRRYKGKTNELFTQFMLNIARFSSEFSHREWSTLRVLDPLAGGGTTLLTALMYGADAVGVEQDSQQSTATFVRQFMKEFGIKCKFKEENLKKLGKRWWLTIGKEQTHEFVVAEGDTALTDQLISGFKNPHLIVTDLPYGIQHKGGLIELLVSALPIWQKVLSAGGALVFSWDATRFERDEMIDVVESASDFRVLNYDAYEALMHPVDRVIKARDVIVARVEVVDN